MTSRGAPHTGFHTVRTPEPREIRLVRLWSRHATLGENPSRLW